MKCRKCDYEYQGNPKFCPECGEPTNYNDRDNDRRRDDDDGDDDGGIFGGIGNLIERIFG